MSLSNKKIRYKLLVSAFAATAAAIVFALPLSTTGHTQTVVIPQCPSNDQFPKPGCFDEKDDKDVKTDKQKAEDEKKD